MRNALDKSKLFQELTKIVGETNLRTAPVDLASYSMDAGPEPPRPPLAVARPASAKEISAILKLANKKKFSVVPRGAGTCVGGGAVSIRGDGVILDLTRLNQVLSISEDDMTVTTQAGITWGALNHELKKKGFRPPFWGPESAYSATVGGAISSASMSSQGSTVAGSAADETITMEVILPNGDIIRTGTDSLPNGGCFARLCNGGDLAGIFRGSMGIFGIITEATLRIERFPNAQKYGAYYFEKWEKGIRFAHKMIDHRIPDILSITPGRRSVKRSWNVDADCCFKFVIEELHESLAEKKRELAHKFAMEEKGVEIENDVEKVKEWWQEMFMRLVSDAGKRRSMWAHCCHRVPLRKLPTAADVAENYFFEKCKITDYGMDLTLGSYIADMAPAVSFYPMLFFDDTKPEVRRKAWEFWDGWLETAIVENGGCPYWMGYAWARHLMPKLRPAYYQFMITLKKSLDPNNILNPGLLTPNY